MYVGLSEHLLVVQYVGLSEHLLVVQCVGLSEHLLVAQYASRICTLAWTHLRLVR